MKALGLVTLALFTPSIGQASVWVVTTLTVRKEVPAPPLVQSYTCYQTDPDFYGAVVWNEQQALTAPLAGIAVDMVNAGPSSGAVPGVVTGTLDSHFIYYCWWCGTPPITGQVKFDGTIVGVAFNQPALDASDAIAAPPGTVYSNTNPIGGGECGRGMCANGAFTVAGNTLTFTFDWCSTFCDTQEIRVFTVRQPCPADYNNDEFVDGIDYDLFNNDFERGDPMADFNSDGFVDGIDYDGFNNAFDAGC